MTDLPFDYGDEARPALAAPRKCRHPKARRRRELVEVGTFEVNPVGKRMAYVDVCGSCGHHFDDGAARRGKNNRQRGKRIERTEMRRAGIHTGNANGADDGLSTDGMFALQAKSKATAAFPRWMTIELDKLRVARQDKVPVLLVAEAPGPGRRGRRIAVVEWSDWLALHGQIRDE